MDLEEELIEIIFADFMFKNQVWRFINKQCLHFKFSSRPFRKSILVGVILWVPFGLFKRRHKFGAWALEQRETCLNSALIRPPVDARWAHLHPRSPTQTKISVIKWQHRWKALESATPLPSALGPSVEMDGYRAALFADFLLHCYSEKFVPRWVFNTS